jgi:hypothetical protein
VGIFDRTSVVHGDEGCRDGHYRVKDKLLEMVVSEDVPVFSIRQDCLLGLPLPPPVF